jgi:AbiV family abortive infection protein
VTVSDAAFRAVGANAVRHLLEADQHYKAGRYPSATASAVLSIEESGKLAFLVSTGSMPKARGAARHAMHAALFLAVARMFASDSAWVSDWRKMLHEGELELSVQQQQTMAAHPELAAFVRRVHAGELPESKARLEAWALAAVAKEQRDGTFKRWQPLIETGLQRLRLAGTYVEVGESGDVVSAPDLKDATLPEGLCAGAACVVVLALALASNVRETLDVRELMGSVPDDLTGFDLLRRAFPILTRIATIRPGAFQRLGRRSQGDHARPRAPTTSVLERFRASRIPSCRQGRV